MGACHKQRVGGNVIIDAICFQPAVACGDIVDLITPVSVAVGGDDPGEAFKNDIGRMDEDPVQGKVKVYVGVLCFHGRSFWAVFGRSVNRKMIITDILQKHDIFL